MTSFHLGLDRWIKFEKRNSIYIAADIKNFRETFFTGSEADQLAHAFESGHQQMGQVPSSAKGHSVGKMLAFVDVGFFWPGAKLVVVVDRPSCSGHGHADAFLRCGRHARAWQLSAQPLG